MRYPLASFLLVFSCLGHAYELSSADIVTTKASNFFYRAVHLGGNGLHEKGEQLAQQMAFDIATQTPAQIQGAFTYLFENIDFDKINDRAGVDAMLGWQINKPVDLPQTSRYQFREIPGQTCYRALFEGNSEELVNAWQALYEKARNAGYQIRPWAKMRIKLSSHTGYIVAELMLGITPSS